MKQKVSKEEINQLKSIGAGLKKLRKERGYSNYHKLAYDMDMPHSQYGRYEAGGNINLLTLIRILNFHEISLNDFTSTYLDR